jgi:hypothetical protein
MEMGMVLKNHGKSNNSRSIYQKCSWKFLADSSGKIKDHASMSGKNHKGTGSGRLEKEIETSSLLKKSFPTGCSKMPRCKAPEILRSEAYPRVHRNDEG